MFSYLSFGLFISKWLIRINILLSYIHSMKHHTTWLSLNDIVNNKALYLTDYYIYISNIDFFKYSLNH